MTRGLLTGQGTEVVPVLGTAHHPPASYSNKGAQNGSALTFLNSFHSQVTALSVEIQISIFKSLRLQESKDN